MQHYSQRDINLSSTLFSLYSFTTLVKTLTYRSPVRPVNARPRSLCNSYDNKEMTCLTQPQFNDSKY